MSTTRPANDPRPTTPAPEENGDQPVDNVPLYRKRRVVIPVAVLIIVAVAAAWYWYVNLRDFVASDDAYVDANRVAVSSKVLGRIAGLTADEGDSIRQGQVLVRLDETDLRAQLAQAQAALDLARESVKLARVNANRAATDYQRAEAQYKGAVITKEQYDHAYSALEAARAEEGIAASRIATARAQVGVVSAQLDNCTIVSPVNGIIARRWALPGDVVQAGQPIFSVYDRTQIWVTANLEETSLHEIRTGQEVSISVDSYPGRIFGGQVFQIGNATAAQFSLIPPNNASGNFTKVTQRVPVKMSILEQPAPGTVKAALLPGMSVEVKIKVR